MIWDSLRLAPKCLHVYEDIPSILCKRAEHCNYPSILVVVQDGVLSQELVHSGLSDLGRTGDGMKMSYLTLSLSVSLDEFISYIMCMLNTLLSLLLCTCMFVAHAGLWSG